MTSIIEGEHNFLGSLKKMYYQCGMVYYNKGVNGEMGSNAKIRFEHFTFENSSDYTGFSSPADMNATDTVIVYNQEVVYN